MFKKTYTKFDKDGRPVYTLTAYDEDVLPSLDLGEIYKEGQFDNTKILVDGEIIEKPESSIVLTNSEATAKTGTISLTNIPNPTTVTITGNYTTFRRDITDGEYEFSIDVAGKYTVKCDSRVELPIEFKVTIS